MIKVINNIDVTTILESYSLIEPNIVWTEYGHKGKQTGLQYFNMEDPWTSAVGVSRGRELEYNRLNPFFKNSIFEEIIKEYNLKRTRLMWVYPFACYTMHYDTTARIHIPLITNPECYFVFKNGLVENLKIGSSYWVDTTKPHTFINCSEHKRLHLVGVQSLSSVNNGRHSFGP
jgi:hypothetical protein